MKALTGTPFLVVFAKILGPRPSLARERKDLDRGLGGIEQSDEYNHMHEISSPGPSGCDESDGESRFPRLRFGREQPRGIGRNDDGAEIDKPNEDEYDTIESLFDRLGKIKRLSKSINAVHKCARILPKSEADIVAADRSGINQNSNEEPT
jgi:hypothetical protein